MLNGRPRPETEKRDPHGSPSRVSHWLRSLDSNQGPSGYEPDELPLLHSAISIIPGPFFGPAGQGLGLGDGAAGAGVAVTRYRRSLGLE